MIKAIVRMVVLGAAYAALAVAYLALAIVAGVDLVVREVALRFVPRDIRSEVRRLNPVMPDLGWPPLRTCNTTGPRDFLSRPQA